MTAMHALRYKFTVRIGICSVSASWRRPLCLLSSMTARSLRPY